MTSIKGDDFEDVFENTFSVEYEVFGEKRIDALVDGGAEKALTAENRVEFVEAYLDYKLNKSVKRVFDAFRNGFWKVADGTSALKQLFEAKELEYLICGTQDFDFDALQRITKYDGFEGGKKHEVVKWFWEVVATFTDDEKSQLLAFSTGSDRVPVGGLEHVRFTIVKQGGDSDRLPTSHTCFNQLLIPEYSGKDKLAMLLRKAIQNSEGFGML